jgi:ParB-like chromosome segregation protein Spo0J
VRDRLEAGVARADNTLILHPSRIVRRGSYVRPFTDDRSFRDLLVAIQEAGNVIHVPILVRIEGTAGAIEYVLVDGTHRLEAARRLNITIPALSLGRLTAEQALAIQAMANEVRSSMHVVDQATYIVALATEKGAGGAGLDREALQRTTGFSAGRVSELLTIGILLTGFSDAERTRARRAGRVTYRALRALKATAATPDLFRLGVTALVEASEADVADGRGADEDDGVLSRAVAARGGIRSPALGVAAGLRARKRGARRHSSTGGFTFIPTRNPRGTSVTYRIAWRSRAIREDPDAFLGHVRDVLRTIAAEATTQYEQALTRLPRGPRATSSRVIAREEAELADVRSDRRVQEPGIPDDQNPMPVPSSQRQGAGATDDTVDPRLLSGLSLPMLARRMRESHRSG